MRGNGGDLIKQVQFPAVFLLPRFLLLQFFNGVYGCLFRHSRVSLDSLWLRRWVSVSRKFAQPAW